MTNVEPPPEVLLNNSSSAEMSQTGHILHRGKVQLNGQEDIDHEHELHAKGGFITSDGSSDSSLEGALKNTGDAFDQADCVDQYAPIDSYEGRHRYDPKVGFLILQHSPDLMSELTSV